jgi:hypothetical protein
MQAQKRRSPKAAPQTAHASNGTDGRNRGLRRFITRPAGQPDWLVGGAGWGSRVRTAGREIFSAVVSATGGHDPRGREPSWWAAAVVGGREPELDLLG